MAIVIASLGLFATIAAAQSDAEPIAICTLDEPAVNEASGLIASRRQPGIYYTHNDSGGRPEVYAFDGTGHVLATIVLRDARNVDWEDIALAPGDRPNEFDICVADIGDNGANRRDVVLYRFPEPELPKPATAAAAAATSASSRRAGRQVIAVECRAFLIAYAEGPQNAEALAIHPTTGNGYVFTKREDGASRVYCLKAPWDAARRATLSNLGELQRGDGLAIRRMVTGADISPDGHRLVVRSYLCGWEYRLRANAAAGDFERIFTQPPRELTLALEPQGEAVAYSAAGDAILTISEKTPVLYELKLDPGN